MKHWQKCWSSGAGSMPCCSAGRNESSMHDPASVTSSSLIRISNSGGGYVSAVSRRDPPEFLTDHSLGREGAGKAGCPPHPQPRVQNKKAHERSHHRFAEFTRPSLRNGFNDLLRALVSAESGRMCERAVLTNRPSLDLSPFVLKGLGEPDGERGTDPVSSSTRTVAGASSPDRARKGAG